MQLHKIQSTFLRHLIEKDLQIGERLPTLEHLSGDLGVSVGKLREQFEIARHLKIVSARPRKGIKREPFDFQPAVLTSLLFGLATKEVSFAQYSAVRKALEQAFWLEATPQLMEEDIQYLRDIITQAWQKLEDKHVPNKEHSDLHLTIFKHLDNPFVKGMLEAYWEAYTAAELTRLMGYDYHVRVWQYHEHIVDALSEGRYEEARQLLLEHFELLPEESS